MDMRKCGGEHFLKVDDVRDGPVQGQIAVVKEGKWDKPNVVFESGDVLSLNATNIQVLRRAYGYESDFWIGKQIELFLGTIQFQGSDREAVLVRPISPSIKKAEAADEDGSPSDDEIPLGE